MKAPPRVFLLSPASCGGERAALLFSERARFDLARRLQGGEAVPLGEVFSFLSGLYFRGKLAYATAFARPPDRLAGVVVITAGEGLRPAGEPVTLERLRGYARVPISEHEPRYREPLLRDLQAADAAAGPSCEYVLLGSVATGKYVEVITSVVGSRLLFPSDFVGRGDMSRGGLMLRAVDAGQELPCGPVLGATRHGARPPRLTPRAAGRGGS